MCSGRYSTKLAQKAFELGAGAVLYSGCHLPADCHFQTGNHWMAKREPRIRGWMKRNGIEDERFRVEWVSAGEGKKWQAIMTEMSEVVKTPRKPLTKSKPKKPGVKKAKKPAKAKKETKPKAKPKSKPKSKKKPTSTKKSAGKKKTTKRKK
jgi:coenzyme F420-reducing hydrogenase delta subunit